MRKKYCKLSIISLLVVLVFLFFRFGNLISANAENADINNHFIYSDTNTYDYIDIPSSQNITNYEYNDYARYKMDSKNGNKVMSGNPQITVLTHGWNGAATTWSKKNSNGNLFGYEDNSLVTKLVNKLNANLFYAKMSITDDKFIMNFKEITANYNEKGLYDIGNDNDLDKLSASKHSIIVFEAVNSGLDNDYIYTQFNYMMSVVSLRYLSLNKGYLPKYNLIGHSRGGITNLQYALDHPDMVQSLYSFGTPYLGTSTCELDTNYCDGMIGKLFMKGDGDGNIPFIGEQDLSDINTYTKYINRWNDNYSLYRNIDVTVLGAKTSLSFLFEIVNGFIDEIFGFKQTKAFLCDNLGDEYGLEIYKGLKDIVLTLIKFLNSEIHFVELLVPATVIVSGVVDAFNYIYESITGNASPEVLQFIGNLNHLFVGIIKLIANEFCFDEDMVWESDIAVNIESQMGRRVIDDKNYEYKGFKRYFVTYRLLSDIPSNITHCLEVYHPLLQNIVLSTINDGSDWGYKFLDSSSVSLFGYYGNDKNLTIPEELCIEGKSYAVKEIDSYAFSNDSFGKNIESITIPKTVISINDHAFSNCNSLKSVLFEGNSLESINACIFEDTSNVDEIKLPNSVININRQAFYKSYLKLIDVSNDFYRWENDLLIENGSDNTSVAIYANPYETSIVIPVDVYGLESYLFDNNQNVTSIDLNNVQYIGFKTFYNSSIQSVQNGHVKEVDYTAFYGTPYLNKYNDSEYLILGQSLLKYTGNSNKVVIPNYVTNIAGFGTNTQTELIILPENLYSISLSALSDVSNLKEVVFTSLNIPFVLDGYIKPEVDLLVRADVYKRYTTDDLLNNSLYEYIERIQVKTINVTYLDINGNVYSENQSLQFGQTLSELVVPKTINGKEFIYYLDQNGNKLEQYSLVETYEDLILKPVYRDIVYNISIDDVDNSSTLSDLVVEERPGYEFEGWFTELEGGELITDINQYIIANYTGDTLYIYKRYKLIDYIMDVYRHNDEKVLSLTFNAEASITNEKLDLYNITRFGYVFSHWEEKNSDKLFKTTQGIYNDIELKAVWLGTSKNIKDNKFDTLIDDVVVLDFESARIDLEYILYVPSNVKVITLIGKIEKYYNLSVIVKDRNSKLLICLQDMNISPKRAGLNGISCLSNINLYIYINGICKINGSNGENGSEGFINGSDGSSGIKAYTINLSSYSQGSSITINGGNGGNGASGIAGINGADGTRGPNGNIFVHKKGENGYRGEDGSSGGNGGNGGYAVEVSFLNALKIDSDLIYSFKGGDGGSGGAGGTGGNGGKGASDTSGSPLNGVGDPGDGGDGGNGGNAGNGGNGKEATNALNIEGVGGFGGIGGIGGDGGTGGSGGSAGACGSDGSSGSDGLNGLDGTKGEDGEDGKTASITRKNKYSYRNKANLLTKSFIYGEIKEYYVYSKSFKQFVNEYNQGQYFNYEKIENILLESGYSFLTKRLRCSYIENQYLVLSAKRENAGQAYLELDFNSYINSVKFDIGLWSSSEGISSSNAKVLLQYQSGSGDWITITDFMNDGMNLKTNMKTYNIDLSQYETLSIRFVVISSNPSGSSNKGRVVLDNFIFRL